MSDSRLNDLLVKPASDLVEQSKETLSKVFQELGGQDNAVATALKIFDAAKMNLPDMDLTEKLGDLAKLGAAPKLGDIATIGGDVATVGSDIARLSDDAAKLGGDVAKLGGDLAKLVSPNLFKTLKHDELGPTLRLLKGLNGAPKLSEIVPLPADPPQPREGQPERSPRDDRGARAVPPAPPENRKENEPAKEVEKGKEKGGEEPPVEGAKRQLGRGGEGKDGGDGAEKAAKAKRGLSSHIAASPDRAANEIARNLHEWRSRASYGNSGGSVPANSLLRPLVRWIPLVKQYVSFLRVLAADIATC